MVKLGKKIRLFSLIALLLSSLVSSSVTNAASKQLAMHVYSQQPYNYLCWATVSSMIISFFKGDSTDRKVEIAKHIYGTSDFDRPGDTDQVKKSVYDYCKRSGTVKNGHVSLSSLQNIINKPSPVAVGVILANGNPHMMCLKGYDDDMLFIINPLNSTIKIYTYSNFCSNYEFDWIESVTF